MEAITEHINIESSFDRENTMVEQTILKLKTKSLDSDHEFKYEDQTCQICMANLEAGERIGDLSCGHSFHVDCLKEWIKRRNACPLCQTQVADPHTILVDREEAAEEVRREIDPEARNRFERLIRFYRRRTTRRINGSP
jgi:hypothetical protein